ncbi:MAG: hypothetical protein KC636_38055, partial [Myxococcales bacterium]|nr:hypothetical protein [Myxococcales bacterium]
MRASAIIALALVAGCSGEMAASTDAATTGATAVTDPGTTAGSTEDPDTDASDATTTASLPTNSSEGTTTDDPSATSDEPETSETSETSETTGVEPPPDRVPAFIAVGHVGRTLLSCDDGETWIEDHAYDVDGDPYVCDTIAAVRCWQPGESCTILNDGACEQPSPCDCDHHPGAAQGVTYGGEWFVGTWGWGPPGSVRRSRDGVSWEPVVEGTTYGGVAYGDGRVLLASREPIASLDDGASWDPVAPAEVADNGEVIWNVRAIGYAPYAEGRFLLTARDGDNVDVLISSNGGGSWWRPADKPGDCAHDTRGIAYGDGVILITDGGGAACASANGGETWTTASVGGYIESNAIWSGEEFLSWGPGVVYRSGDGQAWQSAPVTPAGLQIGPSAINPNTGVIVAVRGGWDVWYESQAFYRSVDGVQWDVLGPGAYSGGHPIRAI